MKNNQNIENKKKENEMKMKIDTKFIKEVAKDFGHTITDSEAKYAHKIVLERLEDREDYYYDLKDYFKN